MLYNGNDLLASTEGWVGKGDKAMGAGDEMLIFTKHKPSDNGVEGSDMRRVANIHGA